MFIEEVPFHQFSCIANLKACPLTPVVSVVSLQVSLFDYRRCSTARLLTIYWECFFNRWIGFRREFSVSLVGATCFRKCRLWWWLNFIWDLLKLLIDLPSDLIKLGNKTWRTLESKFRVVKKLQFKSPESVLESTIRNILWIVISIYNVKDSVERKRAAIIKVIRLLLLFFIWMISSLLSPLIVLPIHFVIWNN